MESTGDWLSAIGYGCMRLPEKGGRIDEERAEKQLLFAIDRGVNYVDTAMPYHMGASEPFLGRALGGGYREKVKLATKMPHWNVRERKDMDRFLSVQLGNLRTDHIDYYLIHNLQGRSWQRLKSLGATDFIQAAIGDGRIRNIGFSYHGGKDDFRAIVDDFPWAFCQLQINYLDRDNQAGLEGMRYAASKGLGIIAMEPLRGGTLGRRPAREVQAIWDQAAVARTPAEWALRWVWDLPEVSLLLSGMNEEAHIEENLRVAGEALPHSLTEGEHEIVDRAGEAYRRSLAVGCTGCRYCLPCPAGVQIPAIFEAYNDSFIGSTHPVVTPRLRYIMDAGGILTGNVPGFASQCTGCKRCAKACPQGLDIPTRLKEAANKFEGPGTKLLASALKGYFRLDGWRTRRKAGRPIPARPRS
jgi:predicted aldo/keto reductase-like oxidoreductase